MKDFTKELAIYIEDNISGITIYSYSHPPIKSVSEQIVSIQSSGELEEINHIGVTQETKTFIVSGTASSSMTKAYEIISFLKKKEDNKFETSNFVVLAVFLEQKPSLLSNENNIFIASFRLKFYIAE